MADTGSGSITLNGSIQLVYWLNGWNAFQRKVQFTYLDIGGISNPDSPRRLCQMWTAYSTTSGTQPTGISATRVADFREFWLPRMVYYSPSNWFGGEFDTVWVKARPEAINKTLSYFWKNND